MVKQIECIKERLTNIFSVRKANNIILYMNVSLGGGQKWLNTREDFTVNPTGNYK